jgi:hypothetical protein
VLIATSHQVGAMRPAAANAEWDIAMESWDAVGYLASTLVLLTFYMKDMASLRVVGLCSNIAFLTYGAGLDLLPVAVLHAALIPINVWRLVNILRERRSAAPSGSAISRTHEIGERDLMEHRPLAGTGVPHAVQRQHGARPGLVKLRGGAPPMRDPGCLRSW